MLIQLPLFCIILLALLTEISAYARKSPRAASCWSSGGKDIKLTMYWVAQEGSNDVDNDGNKLSLGSGPKTSSLKSCSGKVLAKVDESTLEKALMEGTIKLLNGKTYNLGIRDDCFEVTKNWGVGSFGKALVPFVSVAVNDKSLKRKTLYVEELDGLKLPNGITHNGCVRVDDRGWSFGNCQIDFLVGTYANYLKIKLPSKVSVSVKSCQVQTYSAKTSKNQTKTSGN
ncbi:hypothetical protein HK096_009253 [Nowakowskiella sp. JEL0078]|nr:hypothetical protein HK096_009253 [Nowakowskiella sp. JEL0078]